MPAISKRLLGFILLLFLLLCQYQKSIFAHPPDLYRQTITLTFDENELALVWSIQPTAGLGASLWQDADANGDGSISSAESISWTEARLAELTIAGPESSPLSWDVRGVRWPEGGTSFITGAEAIEIQLAAPWTLTTTDVQRLQLHNHFAADLSIHRYLLRGAGIAAFSQPFTSSGKFGTDVVGLDAAGRIPAQVGGTWHATWDSQSPAVTATPVLHRAPSYFWPALGLTALLLGWGVRLLRRRRPPQPAGLVLPAALITILAGGGVFWLWYADGQTDIHQWQAPMQSSEVAAAPAASLVLPDDLLTGASPEAAFSFIRTYIDTAYGGNGKPGWVRAGDMDNDDDLDIVAGGGSALYIYENNGQAAGWTRYGSLDSADAIGANGARSIRRQWRHISRYSFRPLLRRPGMVAKSRRGIEPRALELPRFEQ